MSWRRMLKCFTVSATLCVASAFTHPTTEFSKHKLRFPYQKMGLTPQQAAAHLLSRFTFGATPGQIDQVVSMGLEKWFQQQLDASLPDDEVNKRLSGYDALSLSNEDIANTYVNQGQIIKLLQKEYQLPKDSLVKDNKELIKSLMKKYGLKPPQELYRQLINQKIIRAAYGNNQLQEVLTNFWFNHFNVSLTKNQCAPYILTYERDAIRPNVLGSFETMLEATAKHPAMLEYLDNASSVSNDNAQSRKQQNKVMARRAEQKMEETMNDPKVSPIVKQALAARKTQGLNENYAREIMELHTLGVDGGYTQHDVTEVARALTGWGIVPLIKDTPGRNFFDAAKRENMEKNGFVFEGDFMFKANKHDENEKVILGQKFPANVGYAEGIRVLHMLADHPSTAKFICKKLAVHFVSDHPSDALVNQMAAVFLQSKGNIKAVLTAMVNSTEFWSKDALREKIKSPFELAISSVRATQADVQQPYQLFLWASKMGEKFYYYQAPTGFPDKASYWINTGSLLSRMNFGLAFATEKIPGIKLNLKALNDNHEPESVDAALVAYSNILLPQRNNEENIKRLTQLIHSDNVEEKINSAASKNKPADAADDDMMSESDKAHRKNENAALSRKNKAFNVSYAMGNNSMIGQVTGVIIGSPEFQRR
ncbi:MAG: DUF1800 domain-containing protein [Bacteroidota bacterium]|nr:DUF1800 domain-containing protein [Bacteroidota bacterium]